MLLWVSEQWSLLCRCWLIIQMCTQCISNAAYNSQVWHSDISCTVHTKLHIHTNTHSCLTWAVPGLSGRDLSHPLPCTPTVFNSVSWKGCDPHTLLCCLFLSVSPLLHSFTHSSSHSYTCSILSFAPHAFPPCCLMCLIMWSCSLLCLCRIVSYLTSSSSSSSPSSILALYLFLFPFWQTTDGWLLDILLSAFTSTCGCLSLSLHVTFLCFLLTKSLPTTLLLPILLL